MYYILNKYLEILGSILGGTIYNSLNSLKEQKLVKEISSVNSKKIKYWKHDYGEEEFKVNDKITFIFTPQKRSVIFLSMEGKYLPISLTSSLILRKNLKNKLKEREFEEKYLKKIELEKKILYSKEERRVLLLNKLMNKLIKKHNEFIEKFDKNDFSIEKTPSLLEEYKKHIKTIKDLKKEIDLNYKKEFININEGILSSLNENYSNLEVFCLKIKEDFDFRVKEYSNKINNLVENLNKN